MSSGQHNFSHQKLVKRILRMNMNLAVIKRILRMNRVVFVIEIQITHHYPVCMRRTHYCTTGLLYNLFAMDPMQPHEKKIRHQRKEFYQQSLKRYCDEGL